MARHRGTAGSQEKQWQAGRDQIRPLRRRQALARRPASASQVYVPSAPAHRGEIRVLFAHCGRTVHFTSPGRCLRQGGDLQSVCSQGPSAWEAACTESRGAGPSLSPATLSLTVAPGVCAVPRAPGRSRGALAGEMFKPAVSLHSPFLIPVSLWLCLGENAVTLCV